ncbi:MAG: hypothetical protein AAGJ97_00180 [Planctomycetota bacterium]
MTDRPGRNEITDEEAARWECVDHAMAEVLRRKSGAERLAIGRRMWRTTWARLYHFLRTEHPDWTDEACRRETVRRMSHGAA